ncbi:outer membrane protein assembly factor BamB [Hahella sp. CCB-MM4]|uniref:outer membrane protein assembly factor BamB n=1 Tax=Hahella sp. (strain CCB-MM4) TaxID=1926491 RepID=UPI000B9A8CB7|nr:outer membrane protein assembly factor BamB [Hahella sp. CCB-MM4]OZG73837.1 outer membrane protein assembly factor BamB [Hahella sp. CCB-MM4]
MKFNADRRSFWALFFVVSLLVGCGSDDVRPPPAELKPFKPQIELKRVWKNSAGDGQDEHFLQFSPLLAGGALFDLEYDGEVYAMDLESGDDQWDIDLDEPLVGGVGGDAQQLFVTTLDGDLVALDATSGEEQWRRSIAAEVMAPAKLFDDTVIVQTVDGKLAGYDRTKGDPKWEYRSSEPALTLRGTSQPIIIQDAVITGMSNGSVVAVSARDGQLFWEQRIAVPKGKTELERLVDVDGVVLLTQDALYAVSYQGQLARLNLFNGKPEWSLPISSRTAPTSGFTNIYVSTTEGDVVAFDRDTQAEVWRQSDLSYRELTSPVVWGNYLAVGDLEGYVHILSQVDGSFVARIQPASEYIAVAPIVYDNKLIVTGSDGSISAWDIR